MLLPLYAAYILLLAETLSVWVRMPTDSVAARCSDTPLPPHPPSALPRAFFPSSGSHPGSVWDVWGQLRFCGSAHATRSDPCQQGASICATPAAPGHHFNFAPCTVGKRLPKIASGTSPPPAPHHAARGWRRTLISSASFPEVRQRRRKRRVRGAGFCKTLRPGQRINKYTLEEEASGGACCAGAQASRKHVTVSWKGGIVFVLQPSSSSLLSQHPAPPPLPQAAAAGTKGSFLLPFPRPFSPSFKSHTALAVTLEKQPQRRSETNSKTPTNSSSEKASKRTKSNNNNNKKKQPSLYWASLARGGCGGGLCEKRPMLGTRQF